MTAIELRNIVNEYENKNYIYMNFKVDEDGIWGLPEGSRSQNYLNPDKINKYKEFLYNAIKHHENMARFDSDSIKKHKKYKTYLKRLEAAIKKAPVA
ncbi:hypothetical protein V7128_02035 [Neobacillus vireti]|uniref:hypothetical protein n=1 Tax=Neobacillus vireti TaxID=220686 RepID=UPI002FFFA3BF